MLHSFVSLLPALIAADGAPRHHRRGGRSRGRRPVQDDPGKWIWLPDAAPNSYLNARKLFELASTPTSATIKCTADSGYKLFVNGTYVGKGPVRSGEGYTSFDTHDITQFLQEGSNVIAFLAHYCGEPTHSYLPRSPGLLAKVEIELGEDSLTIGTDETWRVRAASEWTSAGARISDRLGFQEVYDASQAQDGWTEFKFKEKDWEDAVVVGAPPSDPWGELVPREIPQLGESKVLPRTLGGLFNSPERPQNTPPADVASLMAESELSDLKAGSVKKADALLSEDGVAEIKTPRGDRGVVAILDFGRVVSGNVEIGINGSGTGCVDLGYSELLEGGRVKPTRGDMRYTDRLLLKKDRLEWQSFGTRTFRYLQIEFRNCSKAVALSYVRVNETAYPVELNASFECSDSLLNDIWKAGAETVRLCMQDTFAASPSRDPGQWWGDARIESRAAYYAFGDTALLAQGLRQIASSQDEHGMVSGVYPSGRIEVIPDFAIYWVFSILDYYAFSDDAELLRELYPAVDRLLGWFEKYVDEDGLLADVPGWLFLDDADLDRRGATTALNCLLYQALRVASVIASVAGHQEDADSYISAANRLRILINKFLYSPKRGLYAECRVEGKLVERYSRQTNALAALFDVPDHYQKSTILRQITGGPLPEVATPFFTSHLLEALYSGERHDEALEIIRKRWGDMVKAGAGTVWEFFTQDGSLCHGWSASPTRDLLAEFAGIKPVLGSHRFTIAPHTGGLRFVRGSVSTAFGPLSVDWRVVRNSLTITVTVPQGLRADVYPPVPPDSSITVDGKHWPSKFVTVGAGEHSIRVVLERPARPPAPLETLKPVEVPHVEVLDEIIYIGRRRSATSAMMHERGPRGRRRDRKPETQAASAVESEEEIVLLGPGEKPEKQAGAAIAGEGAGEDKPKRRSRRRGGRGRSRGRKEAVEGVPEHEQPTEGAEPQVAEEVHEPAAVEPAEGQPGEETSERRARRPRRRGGRGRRKPSGAAEHTEAEAPAEAEPAREHAEPPTEHPHEPASGESAEPAGDEAPKRKSRTRRGGRGRRRPSRPGEGTEHPEGEAPHEAPAEHQESRPVSEEHQPPAEQSAQEPEAPAAEGEKKRPSRTRGRRSPRPKKSAESDAAEAAEAQEPPVA